MAPIGRLTGLDGRSVRRASERRDEQGNRDLHLVGCLREGSLGSGHRRRRGRKERGGDDVVNKPKSGERRVSAGESGRLAHHGIGASSIREGN